MNKEDEGKEIEMLLKTNRFKNQESKLNLKKNIFGFSIENEREKQSYE